MTGSSQHAIIARLNFEEALTELLAMLDSPVRVSAFITDRGVMVCTFRGRLRQGRDLSAPRQARDPGEGEFFYFRTAEDASAGFFLAERDFATAEWNADRTVLAVRLGPVTLMVEPDEEAPY
jgi:anti-sigma regulatory factor (Ser/Thr protein kinase)